MNSLSPNLRNIFSTEETAAETEAKTIVAVSVSQTQEKFKYKRQKQGWVQITQETSELCKYGNAIQKET